ncbi:YcaO-like family protein [Brevibacillus laterosporus]|uniref:YcaO-like family protein n=1 Tax=Brevibacillus laterosporus TaxID=1465 RepID=UPI003D1CA920
MSFVNKLVQPIGGLLQNVVPIPSLPGEPSYHVYSGVMGNLSDVIPTIAFSIDGAGNSSIEEEAKLKAIAETVERYSSCIYSEKQMIWATARELGEEALDLDKIPRCSGKELQHPRCPLIKPDKDLPIRWVRGISLTNKRSIWVPAIMVYLNIDIMSKGERIWLPISTGCAAHTTLEQALLGAICEVIERDAIAITWLQQLELPKISLDRYPEWMQTYLDNLERNKHIQQIFFDATSDLEIPTLYSVQLSPHNRQLASMVMCSTELDPYQSFVKLMRESASSRIALQNGLRHPEDLDDFIKVYDGATYMGAPERVSAYNFLLDTQKSKKISEINNIETGDSKNNLVNLVKRLEKKGHEVFALDLTTDEARRANLHIVRVIIPTLMPLSFSYRARFLGTPRLYEAPKLNGYPIRTEEEINIWPQPFA